MTDTAPTLERAVAQFVTRYSWNDIDPATLDAAKALIKDQFAIQIGASQLPWSRMTREFRDPRPGKARIVGETTRAAAADAAYLNATYGHGFEYDDFLGNAHPGCCVVPTAFAIGEEVGASLHETIVAMVAGYETYVRIGALASPAILNVGWQPHAVFANFGAAAIAAKLYGLDEDKTFHALAIALSHASGTTEYASTGGSIKRVHAGIAVRNGIEAAQLARAGVTGPRRFLTGDRGLYRMFAHADVTDQARDCFLPGAPNMLPGLSFKPYCCCALTFCYIEAMEHFRDRADEIDSVVARIQTMTDSVVGTRNAQLYHPRNIEELQYSLPTQMALSALGKGNGYATHRAFLEGRLDLSPDSEVMQFARRITLEVATDLDEKYEFFVSDVTVHFKDGTSAHYFQERAKGSPVKPFTEAEFQEKLDELTGEVIGRDQAARLFELVDTLDPASEVADLTVLLQPGASSPASHSPNSLSDAPVS
ncbi:MmgE/PrpD family protein [Rhodococcus sp. NPDC127530]|uniref:MmgE/PrpD family protein n=1 Tax=unclassified Rhodococcus (in: high G+C Gram-positive bacteria) TaxID=192944 RepID=UPI0036315F82